MNKRQYFDADKLITKIYNKIAVWHNNEERLSDIEMGRELRFLSKDIAEDVLKAVHGDEVSIEIDKHKIERIEADMKMSENEHETTRTNIVDGSDDGVEKEA